MQFAGCFEAVRSQSQPHRRFAQKIRGMLKIFVQIADFYFQHYKQKIKKVFVQSDDFNFRQIAQFL